jgi:signal transduction histidine kinase
MAETILCVIEKAGFLNDGPCPLIAHGSVAQRSAIFWEHLSARVCSYAPNVVPMLSPFPPVVGAGRIVLKRLNAEAMRAVRDLAMGLRPSMLDDLGLAPALEWQGREFSRHTGVPATVQVDGAVDDLPETHRTYIYRIVQEALTNCAKHANAHAVRVAVRGKPDRIELVVQDDGLGFRPDSPARSGLGLLGIKERVQELNGTVDINSAPGRGTTIRVQFPASAGVAEWAKLGS